MIKRDELKDPQSCLNKAAPDEPVFVLRARDPVAAQTVRHWATMAHGIHEVEKVESAFRAADLMEKWLAERRRQAEDATKPQAAPKE